MFILALDLGVHTGFAFGSTGGKPSSSAIFLKDASDHRSVACGNLIAWLDKKLREQEPALVVREAPLPLQAFSNLGNGATNVRMTHSLHGIVEGMCVRFGIRTKEVADSTVRKHFIGKARCGTREETKAAVVQRAQLLGYMPKNSTNDNRADACALWDYAAATWGGRMARELHLFGEGNNAA